MKKTIWIAVIVMAALAFMWWVKGQLEIDSCLDSGGRWDYEKFMCER